MYQLLLFDTAAIQASSPTHLLANFDRATSPSGKQDPISYLDRDSLDLSILVWRTWSNGNDGRFWEGTLGR